MGTLNFPEETFVVIATGEQAKTFYVRSGSFEHDGDWAPGNLADEGPSGKDADQFAGRRYREVAGAIAQGLRQPVSSALGAIEAMGWR